MMGRGRFLAFAAGASAISAALSGGGAAANANSDAIAEAALSPLQTLPGCLSEMLWVDPACALWRGSKSHFGAARSLITIEAGRSLVVPLLHEAHTSHPEATSTAHSTTKLGKAGVVAVTVVSGGDVADISAWLQPVLLEEGRGRNVYVEVQPPAKEGGQIAYEPVAPVRGADERSWVFLLPHGVTQTSKLVITSLLTTSAREEEEPVSLHLAFEDQEEMLPLLTASADDAKKARQWLGGPANAPTLLSDGVPVLDAVGAFQWQYYVLNTSIPVTRVDVTLESIGGGDADMYITLDGSLPSTFNSQYKATGLTSTESIAILSNDSFVPRYCAPGSGKALCPVFIGVRGYRAGNFSLVASSAAASTSLISGLPLADQYVAAGGYRYYTLAGPSALASISVTVTPMSGDPDLLLASSIKGTARPTLDVPTSYCRASVTSRREVIELFPNRSADTDCFCGGQAGCTYYIGVLAFGANPTSFSILGSSTYPPSARLLDGQPQFGYTLQGSTAQYTFAMALNTSAGIRAAEISMTSYQGDGDLYVALNGQAAGPGNWQYRSQRPSGQVENIVIRPSDPAFQQWCGTAGLNGVWTCNLNVAAYAYTTVLYSLLATNAFYVSLPDGVTQASTVQAGSWDYFLYRADVPGADLVFTVQQTSGDADMYIGCDSNANTTRPTDKTGTYIWKSSGVGREIVVIDHRDSRVCATPCNYYVGVTAYNRNASFGITGRSRSSTPARLALGQPLSDQVEATQFAYYFFEWDWSRSMAYVEVDPSFGDSDLYVLLGNGSALPSRTAWTFSSTSATGLEMVTIDSSGPKFIAACGTGPGPTPCVVTIGVYGFSTSGYSITAWNTLRELLDGQPIVQTVPAGQYDYFYYTAQDRATPFSFFVTPLDGGDPDIYVSVVTPFPNATNFTWSSDTPGSEIIRIQPDTDPRLARYTAADYPLTFYAGIGAWGNEGSTFSLLASSNPTVTLNAGTPVSGAAQGFTLTYYSFFVPYAPLGSGKSFEVTAVPLSGGPVDLYVNNDPSRPYPICTASCASGAMSNYHWTSTGGSTRSRVLVQRSDPYYATNRQYVIAVYAEANVTYTIVAGFTDGIRTLASGVPQQDTVGPGAGLFYRLLLKQANVDVTVAVTPISGDPDLYVSVHSANTFPGPSSFDKKSNGGLGQVDSVIFQWQEMPECAALIAQGTDCDVYIGVYGYSGVPSNASYTITATVMSNRTLPVLLVDGEPQSGSVNASQFAYFYALVSVPPGQTYSVALRCTSGDGDLYVRTDGYSNSLWPSNTYYQYSSTATAGDDYVNVMPGTAGYNSTALMRIAVYGFTQAQFVITYSSASAVAQLADGVSLVGTLPRGGANYYSFSVPTPGYDISFALTALANDPDIYVSQWPPNQPLMRPGPAGGSPACRSGTAFGTDTVEISSTGGDPCYCSACQYIVGVYCAMGTSCRYAITASLVSPYSIISLSEGRPSSNAVRQWGYKYFAYDARFFNGTQRNVTLRLAASPGSVQAFATNLYVPGVSPVTSLPTNVSGSIWSTPLAGPQAGVISISYADPAVRNCIRIAGPGSVNCSFYTIAVQGRAGGSALPFTLTASSTDQPQLLVPGQPSAPGQVSLGQAQHYAVDLDDVSSDLVVAVTLLSGRVGLSLSPTNMATTCTGGFGAVSCDGVWFNGGASRVGSATIVRVTAASPCSGQYVNPNANCTGAWRPGRYYIGVYGVLQSTFTVTVLEASGLVRMEDSVPFSDQTSTVAPVTLVYQPSYDSSGPSIKLSLDATSSDAGLALYVVSCVEGILGPNACNSAARSPGPTNYYQFITADAGTSQDLIITKFSNAFCSGGNVFIGCSYYMAVYPSPDNGGDCNPPGCDGSFTLTASQASPGGRTQIPFASLDGKVAEYIGTVGTFPAVGLYEIFLPASSQGGAATVPTINLTLEACGPAYPSMYICDPSPASGNACADAFNPSHAANGHTAALFTAAGGAGRATTSLSGLTSSALYASVIADGQVSLGMNSGSGDKSDSALGQSPGQSIGAQYVIIASSGSGVTYLYPPANASVALAVTGDGGTTLNVSWLPPMIATVGSPSGGRPAAAVTYSVYAAPVSFSAAATSANGGTTPPAVVTTTACGLDFWSRLTSLPPVTVTGQTWAELTDLQPNTVYQVNVAATCSNPCWAANGVRLGEGDTAPVTLTYSTSSSGGALGVPGYNTQRLAYAVGSAQTGGGGAPVTQSTPVGVIAAAVVVTVLSLAGGLLAFCRYRRAKALDLTYQYVDQGGVDGAMSTISTPTFVRSASAAGGALLSGIRSLLTLPASAVGYVKPSGGGALADESYSEMDDRVQGFM